MNHLNGDPGGGSVGVPGDVELDTLLPSQRPSVEPSNLASTTNSMRMANVPNSTIVLKPSQTSSALRFSRRTSRSSFWFYEIGAIILSLLFMVAIIVLLSKIDGKPMSSWKLPLSPNTVIAIFSTLSKSAVLLVISECLSQLKWVYFEQGSQRLMDLQIFDDASRGPLGAIHLLVRIRWTAVAASFGALLTLLALAQDAFYQEVYSTYTDDMAQPGEIATIAMARSLDSHLVNMGSLKYTNRDLAASVLSGLSIGREPEFVCPSGNCTWPAFDSLGVCSSCRNVTTPVRKTCVEMYPTEIKCNYTSGSGLTTTVTARLNRVPSGTVLNTTFLLTGTPSSSIARMQLLRIDQEQYAQLNEDTGAETLQPVIYDCELTWCLQSYDNTTVVNGVLHEKAPISSNFLPDYGWYEADVRNCTDMGANALTLEYLVFTDGPGSQTGSQEGPSDNETMRNLLEICPNVDNVSNQTDSFIVNVSDNKFLQDVIKLLFGNGAESIGFLQGAKYAIPPQLIYAANDGDIPVTLEKLARSLSNRVRSGPQMHKVQGIVTRTEVYMRVDWMWLIYPVALLFLALILLLTSLIFSAEKSRAVWKSSSIATLFHGLQGWSKDYFLHERVEDMECDARNMRVRLTRDDTGHLALIRE